MDKEEDFLVMTPGVGMVSKGDKLGQQYRTPRQVVLEDIWARRMRPRDSGSPTEARPVTMPSPGRACALVRCDQEAMRWTPEEY